MVTGGDSPCPTYTWLMEVIGGGEQASMASGVSPDCAGWKRCTARWLLLVLRIIVLLLAIARAAAGAIRRAPGSARVGAADERSRRRGASRCVPQPRQATRRRTEPRHRDKLQTYSEGALNGQRRTSPATTTAANCPNPLRSWALVSARFRKTDITPPNFEPRPRRKNARPEASMLPVFFYPRRGLD